MKKYYVVLLSLVIFLSFGYLFRDRIYYHQKSSVLAENTPIISLYSRSDCLGSEKILGIGAHTFSFPDNSSIASFRVSDSVSGNYQITIDGYYGNNPINLRGKCINISLKTQNIAQKVSVQYISQPAQTPVQTPTNQPTTGITQQVQELVSQRLFSSNFVYATAHTGLNCTNDPGYPAINIKFGTNLLNSFYLPNSKNGGLSSVYIARNFPTEFRLFIPGTGFVLTANDGGKCINLKGSDNVARRIEVGGFYRPLTRAHNSLDFSETNTPNFVPQIVGNAYNAYDCKSERGDTPVGLQLGKNDLSVFPRLKDRGLSSIRLNRSFPLGYSVEIGIKKNNSLDTYVVLTSQDAGKCINLTNFNDQADFILIKQYTCSLLAFGGINSNLDFEREVARIYNTLPKNIRSSIFFLNPRAFNYAYDAGINASGNINFLKTINPDIKILGAFHSISAIGTYNAGVRSRVNKIIFYDPPYNFNAYGSSFAPSFILSLIGLFSGDVQNAAEIRKAKNNNIQISPFTVDMTHGLDGPPNLPDMDDAKGHVNFSELAPIISQWAHQSCKS